MRSFLAFVGYLATFLLLAFAALVGISLLFGNPEREAAEDTASAAAPAVEEGISPAETRLVKPIAALETATASETPAATTTAPEASQAQAAAAAAARKTTQNTAASTTAPKQETKEDANTATRVENPYSFPPLLAETINVQARAAVVNILCVSSLPNVRSISGSGIIIDSKGVILTNAHVAQYFLLAETPDSGVQCAIRTGSPATKRYTAALMHIPRAWIEKCAKNITEAHPTGTGEDDFALLAITGTTDGAPLPASFPTIPADTRNGIGFTGDEILIAGYPAEFVGAQSALSSLNIMTAIGTIGDLLTFGSGKVDAISLGSTALAQGGSSGGAVVNGWGRLVGIITTTSDGSTTAERTLRAVTPAHVNRSLLAETGKNLAELLAVNPTDASAAFKKDKLPSLASLLLNAAK